MSAHLVTHLINKPVKLRKSWLKVFLWILLTPFGLILLVLLLLQNNRVQDFLVHKTTAYLERKIHSKISLKRVTLVFPKKVQIDDLCVFDRQHDTILYLGRLQVDLDLLALFSRQLTINGIELENSDAHVLRDSRGFNFSYIVEAFAPDPGEQVQQDSSSAPWKISLKSCSLKNVRFSYQDQVAGITTRFNTGVLQIKLRTFDLENSLIAFDRISLRNTSAYLQLDAGVHSTDTAKAPGFTVDLGEIAVDSVNTEYRDNVNGLDVKAGLGHLLLRPKSMDLNNFDFNLDELLLSSSSVTIAQFAVAKPLRQTVKEDDDPLHWRVKLERLHLKDNNFSFHDLDQAPLHEVFDAHHIVVSDFNLEAQNLYLAQEKMRGTISKLNLHEHNGIEIKQLRAEWLYDTTQLKLSSLDLETGATKIKGHLALANLQAVHKYKRAEGLRLDLQFDHSLVAVKDILYFQPQLLNDGFIRAPQQVSLTLDGGIRGDLNNLTLRQFRLGTGTDTRVELNGLVNNLLQPKQLYLDLGTVNCRSSSNDLSVLFSKDLIPPDIAVPGHFEITGSFRGYLQNFNAGLRLSSSFGDLSAKVEMDPKAGNGLQPYTFSLATDHFDAGKLLPGVKDLGPVNLTASVIGTGFNFDTLNAALSIQMESLDYHQYTYRNLTVDGEIHQKQFTGKAIMDDPNLVFNYQGTFSFDPKRPDYVFSLDLKGADLRALNLSQEDLRVSAVFQSDIRDRSDKNFTGRASVRNGLIIRDNKKYPLDSLVLVSEYQDGVSKIEIASEILTANFKGDITLSQLPEALEQHVEHYFKFRQQRPILHLNPQKFDFAIKLNDPTLLTRNLVPELKTLSPFEVSGAFDSQARALKLSAHVPQVVYSGVTVDSLNLDLNSDAEKFNYQLGLAEVSNNVFRFENVRLAGELKDNALGFQLNTNKDDSAKTISLGGELTANGKNYSLKFNPELFLNAEKWHIHPANELQFGAGVLVAHQLEISKDGSRVSFNSSTGVVQPPLEIGFVDFQLRTLSRLMENRDSLFSGKVNGTAVVEKQGFKSDLRIEDFVFNRVAVGDIHLKADNLQGAGKYKLDFRITGGGNDLSLNGYYWAQHSANQLDLDLRVKHLDLATVEPFTSGAASRIGGSVNGQLKIRGSLESPDLTGELNLNEAAFKPRIIDSYLTIHRGKLLFASNKIIVNNLLIYDSLNNKASLSGHAGIADLKKISFDASLRTDNFLALNTNRLNNPLYFGRVFLDSEVKIKGDMNSPQIKVKAKLNSGSFITYVKPEAQVEKNESKGVIVFTDSLYHPGIMTRNNDTLKGNSELKGIDLDASLSFDKSVTLKMLVDQDNGDSLFITGGGSLQLNLDKEGRTTLTGRYRINDGGYHLGVSDLVKRNFKIEKGSSVSWSGDPLDPYVDLKAIYVIKTSPVDLVQDELSGVSELERNKYRNLLTFYVYLKMLGFVSSPDINFDIQLAPEDRGAVNGSINSKLAQLRGDETELNKQVFALLTLRRFIGENPLDNGNEGGLTSASRSSASKVLTQQLSSISDRYVNFVDLDLGVNSFEDYSTGVEEGRTQLQVGVSKQLLNDKVTVRVGGNVELEGERARQNNANDVAGNISIDYKLTEDGRFKLKAFRENQYENPIEGELTKTGAGVVYVRNFKYFRDLLKKPKTKNKIRISEPDEKELTDKNDKQNLDSGEAE